MVKEIDAQDIMRAVSQLCMDAAYYLPDDVEQKIAAACESETSPYGQWALNKISENITIAHEEKMPLCQDTGLALVFAELGQEVHIINGTLEEAIQAGVAQGYKEGFLRRSMVSDPVFDRVNTHDNTPAVIHYTVVAGDALSITVLPKGGGSENMSALAMLKPAQGVEGVADFVYRSVVEAGGNPCPPTIVGVGIGGNAEKALLLSKKALARPLGTHHPDERYAQLEQELLERINASGIGPQGLGGLHTALEVHIETFPTHIAMLPVGVSLNCHVARHKQVVL